MDRTTISMQYYTKVTHFTLAVLIASLTSYSGFMCAQAQPAVPAPLSGGFAVSHIDSPSAALTRRSANASSHTGGTRAYVMKIATGSKGQWMGERATTGQGGGSRTRIRVGDLTAERLVTAWRRLRYPVQGKVRGTLTWEDRRGVPQATAVHLTEKPKRTSRDVTFRLTSEKALGRRLKNVSLHITRADESSVASGRSVASESTVSVMTSINTFPSTQVTTIVDTLTLSQINTTAKQVRVSLYDASDSAPACWTDRSDNVPSMNDSQRYWRVDPIVCADVTIMNSNESAEGELWGAYVETNEANNSGLVTVTLLVTPPGAYPYSYTHQFSPWAL